MHIKCLFECSNLWQPECSWLTDFGDLYLTTSMLEGDLSALLCRNFLDSLRGRRAGNGCVGLDKRGAHEYLCGAVNGGDCQFLPHCWRPLFLV